MAEHLPNHGFEQHGSSAKLLSLLLIQILVALAVPYVGGSSAESPSGIGTYNKHTIIGGPPLVKTYQLISRCTDLRVQMLFRKKIDALGPKRSAYTRLNFVSDPTGAIRIKSDTVKNYLCFSRKGRLISRASGESQMCKFKEVSKENYFKLQSVAYENWYVGFNKRGRKLKGYADQRPWAKENCFKFTKVEWRPGPKLRHQRQFGKFSIASLGLPHIDINNR